MSAGVVVAPRRPDWLVPASLVLLSLVPAISGTMRVGELASHAPVTEANARFFAAPLPVVLHVLAVIPYSLLGALQFAPGFRRRHREWHRAAGMLLLVAGAIAAVTGLWMAHFYPWPAGDGVVLYVERLLVGSAMLVQLTLAALAIPRRDFAAHGDWMTRAYALGVGAGTQVLTHLPWFVLVGKPGETARDVLMGTAWAINILVAEWVIARRHDRRRSPKVSGASLSAG